MILFCSTYALVEFSPVLVGAGVCPALVLGVHADLGRVLAGQGPETMHVGSTRLHDRRGLLVLKLLTAPLLVG